MSGYSEKIVSTLTLKQQLLEQEKRLAWLKNKLNDQATRTDSEWTKELLMDIKDCESNIEELKQQIALLPPETTEEGASDTPVLPLTPELIADAAAHEEALGGGDNERL